MYRARPAAKAIAFTMKMNCLLLVKRLPSGESLDENVTGKCADSTSDGNTASQQALGSCLIPFDIIDCRYSIKVNGAEVSDGISKVKGAEGKAGDDNNKLDQRLIPL